MFIRTLSKSRGLTLIEILITIGIFSLLFVFISSPLLSFYRSVIFQGNVENAITMLDEARKSTLSSYKASQYGVHIASTTITLFTGDTYNAAAPDNEVYNLNVIVEVTQINLSGGVDDVVFEKITGETQATGTIVISPLVGASSPRTISVHESGLVEVD